MAPLRRRYTMKRSFLLLLLISSCTPNKPAATQPAPETEKPLTFFPPDAQLMQKDAIPEQQYLIQLVAYRITVPLGVVSRSEDFWKRINEQAVDVPTYELLFRNGIRVGVAPASEWEYVKGILDQNPTVTQPSAFTGKEGKDLDLEIKKNILFQNLFYYDSRGDLVGRTYERAENFVRIAFEPAPRKHGQVRLTICPVFRSQREVVVPVGPINTTSYKFVKPEQIYDLNLIADVPLDNFLVLAPSSEGRWNTSLGNIFLADDGPAARTETVLVFRPIVFRQGPATQPAP